MNLPVVLASLRNSLHAQGTTIVVCSQDLILIARDKRRTAEFFAELGVRSPEVYNINEPEFPALAKPYDGSLSRDIHVLETITSFTEEIKNIPNLMLAQYISPREHDEFTCDAYYDRNSELCCVVPRKRLQVRGGEVAKGRTERNNIVDLFQSHLKHLDGARGCLTFQFFRNKISEELYLIELNARFGGGFPLTHACGGDYRVINFFVIIGSWFFYIYALARWL